DGTGNVISLTGGFLDLSNNANVTLGRLVDINHCSGCAFDTFTQTLGPNEPALRITNSTLNLAGTDSALRLRVDTGAVTTQTSVGLVASGSTINLNSALLDLGGVSLTDPNAQLQLSGTAIHQAANNSLIEVSGLPVTAAGPMLSAQAGSTIGVARQRLLDVNGSLTVNGPGVGALLQFADSMVKTGSEIVFVGPGGRLALDRSLIDAVNTSFSTSTIDTFFTVARGGSVTMSSASPFIRLNSTPVTMLSGEDFIHVGLGGGERASLTLNGGGPLVRLEVMNLSLGSGVLLRVTGSDVSAAGSLLDMVNATLSLTGPVLRTEGGSTITATVGPAV